MGRGEESRRRILERGLSLASTVGLEGLTLGGLADDLKVSKSGLFSHFDSKEALQLAVLQEAVVEFIRQVIAPALAKARGIPRIQALFDHQLKWIARPGGCVFMAATVEYDDREGRVREKLVQAQQDWLEALAKAAQIAVSEGQFRGDLDPEQFAHELQSISLGYQYMHRLMRDPQAETRARAAFAALVDRARKPSQ